jgi:hypothetical protein
MTEDKIIAVGLLTQRDLDRLGSGFQRLYPVPHDDAFTGLLRQLERVEPSPTRRG